jgi:HAMP domain-containing protein
LARVNKKAGKEKIKMANGMGCYFHPDEQSVAQCIKCGKGICRNCVDNYGKASNKYTGLCRDCILEAGIECKDHPSKRAEIYCEKCGEPICEDCYVRLKFCYKCTTEGLNNEIAAYKDRGKIEKGKVILVAVFSVIGLIIGLAFAADAKASTTGWLTSIWLFLGIGGNFRVALSEFPSMYRASQKNAESFWGALGMTFAMAIFFLILKSLAGPIIPILRIREYVENMKTAKTTVADDTDMLEKLADYYSYTQYIEKHGEIVDLAKLVEQGGPLYNNAYANAVLNGKQETYMEKE